MLRAALLMPRALVAQVRPPVQAHALQQVAQFHWCPPKELGHSHNLHRSNRAKRGLYHGKDVRSGHSISHSHTKTKRKFYPNVQNKRLWSQVLERMVRFKCTTTAMEAVDKYGGIDNYLINLDDRLVESSNYLMKIRLEIATALFHNGELPLPVTKKLGFHICPPPKPEPRAAVTRTTNASPNVSVTTFTSDLDSADDGSSTAK